MPEANFNYMSSLHFEAGLEYAADDVSWALLDPAMVHEGRGSGMKFVDGSAPTTEYRASRQSKAMRPV